MRLSGLARTSAIPRSLETRYPEHGCARSVLPIDEIDREVDDDVLFARIARRDHDGQRNQGIVSDAFGTIGAIEHPVLQQ